MSAAAGLGATAPLALPDVDLPRGVAGYAVGTALAGVAALLFALGSVAQHEVAVGSSADGVLRWRALIGRPVWLAGQAASVAAALVQVAALALAPVAIVQPVLAGGLVIALGLRAVRDRRRPTSAEVVGSVLAAGGLGVFLVAARPGEGHGAGPTPAVVAVVAAAALLLMLGAARWVRGRVGALVCGITAGVGLGVAAVLVSAALAVLQHHGLLAALAAAPLWAAVATAVTAMYCSQVAFGRGSLSLSLPALTVVDPVAAVVGARLLLHEHLALAHAAVWAPAATAATVGVVLLAVTAGPPPGDVVPPDRG